LKKRPSINTGREEYGYLHPYLGEEAIATGVISALRPDDYIVSTHRGHGHAIAKGHDIKLMLAELMGRKAVIATAAAVRCTWRI
jgi:TPP-dependent pyruvate/acetoin dehydrogenase alpha subunit